MILYHNLWVNLLKYLYKLILVGFIPCLKYVLILFRLVYLNLLHVQSNLFHLIVISLVLERNLLVLLSHLDGIFLSLCFKIRFEEFS